MNDKQIIRLLFARAEPVLEVLARQFGPRLLQTAINILESHQDAEECVNDTYLAIWNSIPPKEPDPLAGFVYKTGRNLALKRLRDDTAQKRDSRYDLSLEELADCFGEDTLAETVSARELGLAIDRFLDTVGHDHNDTKTMLRNTIIAVAYEVYLDKYLAALHAESEAEKV